MPPSDDSPPRPETSLRRPAKASEEHQQAPTYDTEKKDYRGISTGALDHIEDVRDARAFAEMIVDTVREGLLVLDLDLRVIAANESFYRTFEVDPKGTVGRLVYDLGDGQWDIAELRELLEGILPHEKTFDDFEVNHTFEDLGRRQMLLNARQLDDHDMILLAFEDVTERRQTGRDLRQSEEHYRLLFENMSEGFALCEMIWDEEGRPVDWRYLQVNAAWAQTGVLPGEAAGRTAHEVNPSLERYWIET